MDVSSTQNAFDGCLGMFSGNTSRLQGQNELQAQRQQSLQNLLSKPLAVRTASGNLQPIPTPNEMDRIIAKEMTDLSIQERELAENDVHGIGNEGEENPLQLQTGLLQLEHHLDYMKKGTVYEEAETQDFNYVSNRKFRLMFLRADRYNPKEAAERMIRFFDLKKSLFGTEKLVKDITMDDFDEDDMETLRSGYMQLPSYCDMAGRTLVVGMLKLRKMKTEVNASRVAFYIFMVATESEETQKRGMVCVYYLLDATNFSSVTGKLRSTMPVHIASLHLCYNDITQYAVTCMGVYALNPRIKVRFRPHFGSHIECQYALTTFGIPRQALPVSASGEMFTDQHQCWIESRWDYEQNHKVSTRRSPGESETSSHVAKISWSCQDSPVHTSSLESVTSSSFVIQPNDVLFGRGKTVVEHPGNLRFRKIVGMQMEQYEAASRLEKTCITEKIVQTIQESDGRFLKRDVGGDWEEVDQETADRKSVV